MKIKAMLVAIVMVLSCIVFAQDPSAIFPQKDNLRKISMTGAAILEFPPDHADISISITTLDKSGQAAFALNSDKVRKTLAELETFGITSKDIAINYIHLTKEETERENNTPIFLGYEASNEITFILRDLSRYDQLIAGLLKSGVSEITDVTFKIENEHEKKKEARLQAIKAAKDKADYLANALGQKVCKPIRISETQDYRSTAANLNFYSAPIIGSSTLVANNIKVSASIDVDFLLCD